MSRDGQKVSGVVEGFNEIDAVDRIKREYDIVLSMRSTPSTASSAITTSC